jgi:hypothetical protein
VLDATEDLTERTVKLLRMGVIRAWVWGIGVFAVAAAMGLSACGGSEEAEPTGETSAGTAQTEGTETSGGGGDDRCLPVPKSLTTAIASGLRPRGKDTKIRTTGELGKGVAVRSKDFEKVFYVSAVVKGPDATGTWATNSLKVGEGLIIAADPVAMEFTDWGEAAAPGSAAAEAQGLENDGAQESRDCVEGG